MRVKVLDFGCPKAWLPVRKHPNDVGADVVSQKSFRLEPGDTITLGLGFGLELPAGFGAFIFPRSSMSARGIESYLPPLDPGYTGEMHAILHNDGYEALRVQVGERIGQLVILPVATPDFDPDMTETRGTGAFGSTGK